MFREAPNEKVTFEQHSETGSNPSQYILGKSTPGKGNRRWEKTGARNEPCVVKGKTREQYGSRKMNKVRSVGDEVRWATRRL